MYQNLYNTLQEKGSLGKTLEYIFHNWFEDRQSHGYFVTPAHCIILLKSLEDVTLSLCLSYCWLQRNMQINPPYCHLSITCIIFTSSLCATEDSLWLTKCSDAFWELKKKSPKNNLRKYILVLSMHDVALIRFVDSRHSLAAQENLINTVLSHWLFSQVSYQTHLVQFKSICMFFNKAHYICDWCWTYCTITKWSSLTFV